MRLAKKDAAVRTGAGTSVPAPQAIRDRPKLGDRTERLLAGIGITPERYVEAKVKFGLPPTCHCEEVKAWLNKVSDWWRGESTIE